MSPESGAIRVVRAMQQAGARCVFGLPGTQTVPLFESLRKAELRTVLAASEAGAAFMAAGWARATGEPGVLLTIPGPGFTWALPGVAEAKLDSIPLVHLTLRAREGRPRGFSLQDIDQSVMAGPIVKRVIRAEVEDLETAVAEAFRVASTGEPGPVLLELGSDALTEESPSHPFPRDAAVATITPQDLLVLQDRIRNSRRPLFLVGQGAIPAAAELLDLADVLGAPVVTTPSARGVIPEDHPLSFGFDPFNGNLDNLNRLLETRDLILVLGAKLGHNGSAGFQLRLSPSVLVQVDAEPENLGATYPISHGIAADVATVLRALQGTVPRRQWSREEIVEARDGLRAPADPLEPRVDPVVYDALNRLLDDGGIVVLDSGHHQICARRHLRVRNPRSLLFPSDFQSMGFGIPAAIGAAVGAPDRAVAVVVGDGGFAMTGMELLSAAREGIRLLVFVFVDGYLGQIRRQQLENHGAEHAVGLRNPDFSELAHAMGIAYRLADGDLGDLAGMTPGVTLIEVPVSDSRGLGLTAAKARIKSLARDRAPAGLLQLWRRLRGGHGPD